MWEWLKGLFNRDIEEPFPPRKLTDEEVKQRDKEYLEELYPRY